MRDLKAVGISDGNWYSDAQDKRKWRAVWSQRLGEHQQTQKARGSGAERNVECTECGRCFRRESDRKRHMCVRERMRPVNEQAGAVQCGSCERWFRSRGGLAVHRCRSEGELEPQEHGGTVAATQRQVEC